MAIDETSAWDRERGRTGIASDLPLTAIRPRTGLGAYRAWLESAIADVRRQNVGAERLVFINAWNDWTECAYLEPDLRWGHAHLEATKATVDNVCLPGR